MIIKEKLSISEFAEHITGMRGYYECLKDSKHEDWRKSAMLVKRAMDNILKFAYVHHEDAEAGSFRTVCLTIPNTDLGHFYGVDDWGEYDTSPMDFEQFFREKAEEYKKSKEEEMQYIRRQYYEYLDGEECNSRGKKSKSDFARRYGYNTNYALECLKGV